MVELALAHRERANLGWPADHCDLLREDPLTPRKSACSWCIMEPITSQRLLDVLLFFVAGGAPGRFEPIGAGHFMIHL